ncbi:hypothetical protein HAX54_053253 [Datura stramonium]|uniref:Uncharacterized protein n=1 Tax=Datura stramonium TaxID=4076 RepID=A0ABS8T134_DATST|nr:hypothetical protein [Datura stramonium]
MTPTTNTEGEPGTQDKNTQHEHLNTFRMPDEQGTTPDLSHHGTTEEHEQPDHVYRLHKASYGLKQAPRVCPSMLNVSMAEEAPPSTQGELPSAVSETTPGSKEKQPVTQMTFDLHTATARVTELKRENAQLKDDLSTANAEISTLKDIILSEQSVHHNKIDKLLSLIDKTTYSSS